MPMMPAKTKARNAPVPAMNMAMGAMMKTEAVGATPEIVIITLPSTCRPRSSSCLYCGTRSCCILALTPSHLPL